MSFQQLNKWFVDNLSILNCEKSQCVDFTLKYTVHYEAPIGYNINFFSNSISTKFLGVIIENRLSRKAHIDNLLPKLCMAQYSIMTIKCGAQPCAQWS